MQTGFARNVDSSQFAERPELIVWRTRAQALSMPPEEIADYQLSGLRTRFNALKDRIRALKRLAAEHDVDQIETLEDGAKLLFKHSVYKSYPISFIEKNSFDRLTAWLTNLTTADLSGVDMAGVASIDEWLDQLRKQTGVRIIHSTGTSGKLSFLPRAELDRSILFRLFVMNCEDRGDLSNLERIPFITLGHRHMYNGYGNQLDVLSTALYHGDESMIVAMNPGRLSADVLSLGGRLAAGATSKAKVSPALLARRDAFIREQREAPTRRAEFFETLAKRLKGARVFLTGNWTMLFELAEEGATKGLDQVFARDSLVSSAGGSKGRILPENFRETVKSFLGVERISEGFGMSEMSTTMPKCEANRFHAMPWMILYLLSPQTGEPASRKGSHTGRFGVIDLTAQTYWGGFLSGDEVTMHFDPCPCGKTGVTISDSIRRYSEIEGGDDKITCAGAPEAHDNALAFLAEYE